MVGHTHLRLELLLAIELFFELLREILLLLLEHHHLLVGTLAGGAGHLQRDTAWYEHIS